jgi:hypothetical protein
MLLPGVFFCTMLETQRGGRRFVYGSVARLDKTANGGSDGAKSVVSWLFRVLALFSASVVKQPRGGLGSIPAQQLQRQPRRLLECGVGSCSEFLDWADV